MCRGRVKDLPRIRSGFHTSYPRERVPLGCSMASSTSAEAARTVSGCGLMDCTSWPHRRKQVTRGLTSSSARCDTLKRVCTTAPSKSAEETPVPLFLVVTHTRTHRHAWVWAGRTAVGMHGCGRAAPPSACMGVGGPRLVHKLGRVMSRAAGWLVAAGVGNTGGTLRCICIHATRTHIRECCSCVL